MSEGAPRTVGGRQVIPVTQVSDRDTTTLCVSATGPATVLACVRTGANPATATFGGFGVPVKAEAPSGAVGRLGPRRHRPSDAFVGANSTDPGTLTSFLTHRIDDGFYPAGGGAYNTAQRLRADLQADCPFV